jgi:aerobic-type carbon monoxide dehydrogenase small subunit (CoxS/CutS family)
MITLTVNETQRQVNLEPDTPLLWTLRDAVGPHRH